MVTFVGGLPFAIGNHARSLEELKKLPLETQALLLLKQLHQRYVVDKRYAARFCKQNILARSIHLDPEGVATGFSGEEVCRVIDHLLGKPWQYLEQNFLITSRTGDGWFELTDEGLDRAKGEISARTPDQTIIGALAFLHSNLRDYGHYFYEGKPQEAVKAAFSRVENRLNELRDNSGNPNLAQFDGLALTRKLFDFGILKLPYSKLASGNITRQNAFLDGIKNFLAGGIGWFRNSYQHEPHNLPALTDADALELLFIASSMLHLIDRTSNPI